jgi:hypothetical protein
VTKIRFFRDSQLATQCDTCGGRVDLVRGGVCTSCRQILCYAHLYGSWVRRLLADLGGETQCVRCRATAAMEKIN